MQAATVLSEYWGKSGATRHSPPTRSQASPRRGLWRRKAWSTSNPLPARRSRTLPANSSVILARGKPPPSQIRA